ncbi:hypothetical protein M441DRAFT_460177 [Trichoderma asperellum CBS 433.97]|uniref:F-box domain-containing protein n=2 Tax=Trichoderma asperellum TaxID=101201 RepID=A0A2T3Z398_TRIA4|nr:hypothetical protein M441DRAFT_460177 [Trichoderma asperellum CBS 433.97]PTB39298.1 hypothetical protein M441DRAFT_460177 [Trichoderma asperellum CBS 433.97]
MVYGGEYGDEDEEPQISAAMKLPVELVQQVYQHLLPGGWWSSMTSILSPMRSTPMSNLSRESIMGKWLSRECSLLSLEKSAFVEVGCTDFSAAVPGSMPGDMRGAMNFTVSLCGRFLMAVHGRIAYIYELNHVCFPERLLWSLPIRRRQGLPLGLLRPVARILCPRRVISCSMDTSSERYSVAFLMEGRVGMVCDITTERTGSSSPASSSAKANEPTAAAEPGSGSGSGSGSRVSSVSVMSLSSSTQCICQERLVCYLVPLEDGPRSLYRNVCHPDDPPRAVAICPQRKCVAFGCGSGIELHWVDAMTGQNLSRWFPLTSPSDFLYFLPPRRGVDTPRKLRLISSAAGLGNPMDLLDGILHGFSTSLLGSGSTAIVSSLDSEPWHARREYGIPFAASGSSQDVDVDQDEDLLSTNVPQDSPIRRLAAASADHFRAVPLSDGYHILFTDPRTGNLCLGSDAPVGSLTRLLRKIWFRPPQQAYSPAPLLYAVGADTRHGVRVVATFAARRREEFFGVSDIGVRRFDNRDSGKQLLVFYTVPPDIFYDMRRADSEARSTGYHSPEDREPGRSESRYSPVDIFSDPFEENSVYPMEIHGHVVATCGNLTEIALNSSPDLIIWAFAAEGWAKTWVLDIGRRTPIMRSAAQRDGSIRQVDADGDVIMTDSLPSLDSSSEMSSLDFNLFDGAPISDTRGELVVSKTTTVRRCHGKRHRVRGDI